MTTRQELGGEAYDIGVRDGEEGKPMFTSFQKQGPFFEFRQREYVEGYKFGRGEWFKKHSGDKTIATGNK